MGAFQSGFRIGSGAAESALDRKRQKEEDKRREEQHELNKQLLSQQIADGARRTRLNQELDTENAGIRSYLQGNPNFGDNGVQEPTVNPGVNASTRSVPSFNVSDPDHIAGLNRRLMSVSALKGDYATLQTLQDRNRELADMQVFNKAVEQFSVDPGTWTDYTRWVNKNNPLVSAAPARDPRTGQLTGYNIMTVGPSGDATHKFISPQQAATLAGATALMRVNPSKALQLIASVDTSLAASIQALNASNEKATTTGNTAVHYANQDATSRMNAESNRTIAGAAATRASREKQSEGEKLQEKVDAYAGILMRQNPSLSKAEADKQAAGILLRDPNAKEQDVGLAEAGIFRIGKKYYQTGKDGKPEEVQLPGESKLDKALEAYTKGKGAGATTGNSDPFENATNAELQRIAKKPRGVSSAEARAAQEELDRRASEPRLTSF